jgi:type I pantothenate kinase
VVDEPSRHSDAHDADAATLDVVAELVLARTTPPAVVAVAGSVAVGKSTVARQLRDALVRLDATRSVVVLATDAFLLPNAELDAAGLTLRKGFPESYDHAALQHFLRAVRRGEPTRVPVYSHQAYDVVPGRDELVDAPDLVVLEGVNTLQPSSVGELVDVGIYLDAAEHDIERWFVERFARLRRAPDAAQGFYGQFVDLDDDTADAVARWTWREINLVNLREHIAPSAAHAHVILRKGSEHRLDAVVVRDR